MTGLRVVIAAMMGAGLFAAACGGGGSGPRVTVTPVRTASLTLNPGGSAPVVGGSETTVTVARRGTVTSLPVAPGEQVRQGQPVATVRELGTPTEQQALASQLESLQTFLVVQRGNGSTAEQVDDTLVRIAGVRQQLAEVIGAPTVLTAPQGGVVAALNVATGSPVDTSKPLMRIVDMSSVRVTVDLAGEYRTVVHAGDRGQLLVAGSGGRSVPATVSAIVPSTRDGSGFEVTATADNSAGILTVGTTAYLRLQVRIPAAVVVPTRAVLGTSAVPYVYVVRGERAALVRVTVAGSDGTWSQVLTGLSANDRVVLTGNQSLTDGDVVRVAGEQVPS